MIFKEGSEAKCQSKLRNDKRSEIEYVNEIEIVVAYGDEKW